MLWKKIAYFLGKNQSENPGKNEEIFQKYFSNSQNHGSLGVLYEISRKLVQNIRLHIPKIMDF